MGEAYAVEEGGEEADGTQGLGPGVVGEEGMENQGGESNAQRGPATPLMTMN